MNITPKREEVVQFSRVYAVGPHGFGVMKDSPLAKLAGKAECVAEAEALLAKIGIADKRDHYPAHLSGGQQQRASRPTAASHDAAALSGAAPAARSRPTAHC